MLSCYGSTAETNRVSLYTDTHSIIGLLNHKAGTINSTVGPIGKTRSVYFIATLVEVYHSITFTHAHTGNVYSPGSAHRRCSMCQSVPCNGLVVDLLNLTAMFWTLMRAVEFYIYLLFLFQVPQQQERFWEGGKRTLIKERFKLHHGSLKEMEQDKVDDVR